MSRWTAASCGPGGSSFPQAAAHSAYRATRQVWRSVARQLVAERRWLLLFSTSDFSERGRDSPSYQYGLFHAPEPRAGYPGLSRRILRGTYLGLVFRRLDHVLGTKCVSTIGSLIFSFPSLRSHLIRNL